MPIRTHTCHSVVCDCCQRVLGPDEEFQQHYDTEASARAAAVDEDWTITPDGTTVCDADDCQAAAVTRTACRRCRRPFAPDDKGFDGAAQEGNSGFCLGCVDRCHEAGADHRCVICTPEAAQ